MDRRALGAVAIILGCLGAALTVAAEKSPASWHVSLEGKDTPENGTAPGKRAFRTINYAMDGSRAGNHARAGDTLLIQGGTYGNQGLNTRAGQVDFLRDNPNWPEKVTIKNHNGEKVVIKPTSVPGQGNTIAGLYYVEHLTIDGLIFDASRLDPYCDSRDGDNDPTGISNGRSGGKGGRTIWNHITIKNCELDGGHNHAYGLKLFDAGPDADGITGAGNMEIYSTKIHGWGWPRDSLYFYKNTDHGIYYQADAPLIVKDCEIYDNGGGAIQYLGSNSVVAYNRFYDNAMGGIYAYDPYFGGSESVKVYNNLIYNTRLNPLTRAKFGANIASGLFLNNTVYNLAVGLRGTGTYQNNIIYGNAVDLDPESSPNGSNNVTRDPNFLSTDPASPDFLKIGPGSRARGSGLDLSSYLKDDYTHTARGTLWDIGAYRYR